MMGMENATLWHAKRQRHMSATPSAVKVYTGTVGGVMRVSFLPQDDAMV
jgi:hypothetical protein